MVTLKLAATADGFAAGGEHDPRLRITGEIANLRVQVMRAMHEAIMIGVGTALADDPLLTVRLPGVEREPLRVVLDTHLRSAAALAPLRRARAICRPWPSPARGARGSGRRLADGRRRGRARRGRSSRPCRPREALRALSARGVTRVFSEGGPQVAGRLIALGLADEVVLFTAEKPLGRPGLPALDAPALAAARRFGRYRLLSGPRTEAT